MPENAAIPSPEIKNNPAIWMGSICIGYFLAKHCQEAVRTGNLDFKGIV
jgi:hypothetical protein